MKNDKPVHNQTVLISNDKISVILPSDKWEYSNSMITIIDAQGKYQLPASAEMHTHGNDYSRWVFNLFLYYGNTTIRFMDGNEALLEWRDCMCQHQMLSPDISVAAKLIDGNLPVWGKLQDGPVITQPDSAELVVLDQMKQGYEFIKLYPRLSPAVYKKLLQAYYNHNIKVMGHIPVNIPREDILTRQTGDIEHLSGYARMASNFDTVFVSTRATNSDAYTDQELGGNYSMEKIYAAERKTKAIHI